MNSIEFDTHTGSEIFRRNILRNVVLSQVVVREINTDLYLNDSGLLTDEIEHAKRFDSATAALLEATCLRLEVVEIVPID